MEAMEIIRGIFQDYWQRIDGQLDGLSPDEVYWTPNPHSNSIGLVTWHLAPGEDRGRLDDDLRSGHTGPLGIGGLVPAIRAGTT